MERQNYAFFFGCRTNEGVKADTKMIDDLVENLFKYNKIDFSIQFPKIFDDMTGTDANFECIRSNTL